MDNVIKFSKDLDYSNIEVERSDVHIVKISVDGERNYAALEFGSREALFEMGRSLMEAALYGNGEIEFYPLIDGNVPLVVNGVRCSEDSARMFIHFPRDGKHEL